MRHLTLQLLAVSLTFCASAQSQSALETKVPDTTTKVPSKTTTVETIGDLPLEEIQVYGVWVVDKSAVALLTDRSGKKIIRLTFQPDEHGSKLVSASIDSETAAVKLVVFVDGKTHTFTRTIADMPSPPGDLRQLPPSTRGPTEEDRHRYEALSVPAREKFRDQVRQKFSDEKFRNAPEEDRRNAIRTIFEKIEKEDKGGK